MSTEDKIQRSMTRWQRAARGILVLAVAAAAIFTTPVQAQSVAPANQWTFAITPSLWLPNLNGELKYDFPSGNPEVEIGPNDYLENLKFGLMITGEIRQNRWLLWTDFMYVNFGDEKSSIKTVNFDHGSVSISGEASASTSLESLFWTLSAGYAVVPARPMTFDVFGGVRYAGVDASVDWELPLDVTGPAGVHTFPRDGSISQRVDLWDGIVGVKGGLWLGNSNWLIPYYFDIGTGASDLTWQGMLGLAYAFGWGDISLAYRYLHYEQGDDKLLAELSGAGPLLSLRFRF